MSGSLALRWLGAFNIPGDPKSLPFSNHNVLETDAQLIAAVELQSEVPNPADVVLCVSGIVQHSGPVPIRDHHAIENCFDRIPRKSIRTSSFQPSPSLAYSENVACRFDFSVHVPIFEGWGISSGFLHEFIVKMNRVRQLDLTGG